MFVVVVVCQSRSLTSKFSNFSSTDVALTDPRDESFGAPLCPSCLCVSTSSEAFGRLTPLFTPTLP